LPSIPEKAAEESAAKPPGPVKCTDRPAGLALAMDRMSVTAAESLSQPALPALTGT